MKTKFNINLYVANKQLPHMYWLSKRHKPTSKTSIAVPAAHHSVKPLSALKILHKQIEPYHTKFFFLRELKRLACQNNEAVLAAINRLNNTKRVSSIQLLTSYGAC